MLETIKLKLTKEELNIIIEALQDNKIIKRQDLGLKIQNGGCNYE